MYYISKCMDVRSMLVSIAWEGCNTSTSERSIWSLNELPPYWIRGSIFVLSILHLSCLALFLAHNWNKR